MFGINYQKSMYTVHASSVNMFKNRKVSSYGGVHIK